MAKHLKIFVPLVFIVMLFSAHHSASLPFWSSNAFDLNKIGWDFHVGYIYNQNPDLNTFQTNPYTYPTDKLKDLGRPATYPFPMYAMMFWTRWVQDFNFAAKIWSSIIALLLVTLLLSIWREKEKSQSKLATFTYMGFTFLLLIQSPTVFALERGNNDIIPFLFLSLSLLSYLKNRPLLAGIFTAVAVMLKVYPLFTFIVFGGGGLIKAYQNWKNRGGPHYTNTKEFRYVLATTSTAVMFLLFRTDWWFTYVFVGMPEWSRPLVGFFDVNSHSLRAFPSPIPHLLFFSMAAIWIRARIYSNDHKFIFAGAMALNTFFNSISWDYNLMMTYPLIGLMLQRCLNSKNINWDQIFCFFLLMASMILHRGLFNFHKFFIGLHTLLQVGAISLTGYYFLPVQLRFQKLWKQIKWKLVNS